MRKALLTTMALPLLMASCSPESPPAGRPAKWAKPLSLAGVSNLHQVSEFLYRSAQPTAEGMRNLKALGIKTIVSLRSSPLAAGATGDSALEFETIPLPARYPGEEEAIRFLQVVGDPNRTPVLVHCEHGSIRTGAMCAVYRMSVEGWTENEAIMEMIEGGYGYPDLWRPNVWWGLVHWIQNLNIELIKREAGRQAGPAAPRSGSYPGPGIFGTLIDGTPDYSDMQAEKTRRRVTRQRWSA